MKLLLLGATGGTGRHVLEQALAAGHEATGFARRPLPERRERLSWVAGDVRDAGAVRAAVPGHDAVVWTIGARPLEREAREVCAAGTENLVAAMEAEGVRRIVVEGAYGAGESRRGGPYPRWLRLWIRARLRDKERQEEILRASGLDWTVVRPTILTDGPRTGSYRVAEDLRVGWFPRVSRADVAELLLRAAEKGEHARTAVAISG